MKSRRVTFAGRALWLAAMLLAGCMTPPDLPSDPRVDAGAAPPLLPLSDILAQANSPRPTESNAATTQARAAALQARAAALRGPVLQSDDRARMIGSEAGLR